MTVYSKPELDAMSKSELVALARELGVQVSDDLDMLVYGILDAQVQASIEKHKKQTRRKASTKTSTKASTKTSTKAKTKSKTKGNNEEWAKTQLEKVQEETRPIDEKTRELLTGILTKWSCRWEVDEDGFISFRFQGGNFNAYFNEDSPFVTIYYFSFYSVETCQKEKAERVKELINRMNLKDPLKMVYTVDPDDGVMLVHIVAFLPLLPEIPNVEDYLKAYLQSFFQLHHDFDYKMEEDE